MLKKAITYILLERPYRKKELPQIAGILERSGSRLEQKMRRLDETDRNRIVLRHIIGIERWGQRRLQVALGEPLAQDEYDDYRPERQAAWQDYLADFHHTRARTVSLAHDLHEARVKLSRAIPHNQYGDLTVRGWLRYLEMHAKLESRRLR